jgi:hypothetical protein
MDGKKEVTTMFTKPIIYCNLLSFLTEKMLQLCSSHAACLLSRLSVQGPPFHHLKHLANCHDTWYERHGIGGDRTP